jgi:formamidopyrimidine-DNA glycosylase
VLLDQRVIAGIGNRWMTEGLWQARLSPWQPAGETGLPDLTALLGSVRGAMLSSVDAGRSPARVHGRPGRPCPRCGEAILSARLGEHRRFVTWCATCQPSAFGPSTGDPSARAR